MSFVGALSALGASRLCSPSATIRRQTLQVHALATTKIHFSTTREVGFGESHKIVGGHPSLGSWDVGSAPTMNWNDGNVWTLDVDVPGGEGLEFKCIKVAGGHVEWEGGNNRCCQVPNGATKLVNIAFAWGDEGSLAVQVAEGSETSDSQPSSNGATSNGTTSNGTGPSHSEPAAPAPKQASKDPSGSGTWQDDRLPHQQWQGRDVAFMRSNEHSRERQGVWSLEGLQGATLSLVQGDQKHGNWLGKLETTKKVLVDEADKMLPDMDALASAYIYLQLISTGAIPCVEGGGHHRPNRHAELSRDIFRALERVIELAGDDALKAVIARKVHARLPSFSDAYTQSTPLTRIRDIAHRNDIPSDLKQEIKHTIQNKLHRNAGPEDLVATEAMLTRITQDGSYSQDFVKEFQIFTHELRDFFNAGSFKDMLDGLGESLDEDSKQAADRFLQAKGKADAVGPDAQGPEAAGALIEALHSLTSLRATLAARLSSGLRNDAPDNSISMRQRWRLCEIRAEEVAFVLLSRFLNLLEVQGGPEALAQGGDKAWALPLGAAVLGVRHLGLGGWQGPECMAIENELGTWQSKGSLNEHLAALRLKSSLERAQRLTQAFTDALLAVLPERADTLGRALGIEDERIQVFTEAEVRASVVFQLSRLVTLLLKGARLSSGGAEWDAMVAGRAVGVLREVDTMEAGALSGDAAAGPLVLLVKSASGDEEVGAAAIDLRGVLLCHSLPHLSHLGVRARQEKVVFAMCDDEETISAKVRPLIGQRVVLTASTEGVTIAAAEAGEADDASASAGAASSQSQPTDGKPSGSPSQTEKVKKAAIVPLAEAEVGTCGSKAAACAQLQRLAEASGSAFKAPTGVVLPFGCMDLAIKDAKKVKKFQGLLKDVEAAAPGQALDDACEQLQALISDLKPSKGLLQEACSAFEPDVLVIVRSSANVEDLEGMSGAGLYDSLANVPAGDPAALGKAVTGVWASLYTRRAVLTRRAAGVPQAEACMAVLVQEQLSPDTSFVLHTASPLGGDADVLVAELAVGLGETLASGTRGSPWRLAVDKASGKTDVTCFANFSQALTSAQGGSEASGNYKQVTVDYSRQALSVDADKQQSIGKSLSAVGVQLEDAFGGPQDVEGALTGSEIYVVQTRPQP
ncbi:hypothetical protein WJX73_000758 [Symbiochloris irregularis]|uniref:CBM20 domain-containing protein n=1 Tax=Symbiochloris irregularis TaxID=706552 RepID=A0AAW1PEF3_9CHLO